MGAGPSSTVSIPVDKGYFITKGNNDNLMEVLFKENLYSIGDVIEYIDKLGYKTILKIEKIFINQNIKEGSPYYFLLKGDECIDYMIENKYDDLITVNENYKRSGSVRIFKYDYLYSGQVSKRLGCIKDSAIDIHYQEDLELAKQKLK